MSDSSKAQPSACISPALLDARTHNGPTVVVPLNPPSNPCQLVAYANYARIHVPAFTGPPSGDTSSDEHAACSSLDAALAQLRQEMTDAYERQHRPSNCK